MGPQRCGYQFAAVGRQHGLLGKSLGMGIVTQIRIPRWIRDRLVDVFVWPAVIDHTRRTRVDELPNALFTTASNDMFRADGIDAVKHRPRSPDAGHCRDVEDDIDSGTRGRNRFRIADVTSNGLNAELIEQRIRTATKHTYPITPREELFDNVRAEETSTAGNECEHGFRAEEYLAEDLGWLVRACSSIAR